MRKLLNVLALFTIVATPATLAESRELAVGGINKTLPSDTGAVYKPSGFLINKASRLAKAF